MKQFFIQPDRRFPRSFTCTIVSLCAFLTALIAGILCSEWLFARTDITLSIEQCDLYAGCDLAPEFGARAPQLCRETVVQLFLVWASAYIQFERTILALLFASRGFSFGVAYRLCILLGAPIGIFYLALAYAAVTLVLFVLVFHMRTGRGLLPLADSVTAMMIAGGFSCAVVIAATLFI